jgi:Protein of unknown function (DUF4232)
VDPKQGTVYRALAAEIGQIEEVGRHHATVWSIKMSGGLLRARILKYALAVLIFGGASVTLSSARSASGASVPRCTASNALSARFVSPNGAAGLFYFLISFTNSGPRSCFLAGVPHAQAVEGTNETSVGPPALYLATPGMRSERVDLTAHGGKAYVEYYIRNEAIWTRNQCGPQIARGVILRPAGTKSFYIPINRLGATEVCTKVRSTNVGLISAKSY